MFRRLKEWARSLKRDVLAVYLAARDPRVPWYAKALALLVAAYAFSPIDLIPDFVPVLGYLDDAILLPLGVLLVLKLMPRSVMADCRAKATLMNASPKSCVAAAIIVTIWLGLAALCGWLAYRYFSN